MPDGSGQDGTGRGLVPDGSGQDGTRRADALAELVLPDHDGRPVRLRDLWRDRPAALVWLRHYG